MRHKGIQMKITTTGPRVMSALQIWLWLLLFIFQNEFRISCTAEPGYLDFDNLPETNFSCVGKVVGGYYADLETDCQMFHVCTIGQHDEPMDIKFLCLNGTVFDQETRVCERVDEVDCSKSERFYSLNLELYGNTTPPIIKAEIEDSDDEENDNDEEYDSDDNYQEPSTTPKTTTTTITTTTTTTPSTTTTKLPAPTITKSFYTTSKPSYYQTTIHDYHDDGDSDEYDIIDDNPHLEESNKTLHSNDDSQVQRPIPPTGVQNNQFVNYATQSNVNSPKPSNSQQFSPEEFIYHHNKPNYDQKTPAISFQQQSYSNDGQNSHVTVTTHIGGNNYNPNQPKTSGTRSDMITINKSYIPSSTQKPSNYHNYQPFNSQKRTPLVPPNTHSQAPTGHPGLSTPKKQNEPLYFRFPKPSLAPQGFKANHPTHSQQTNKPTNIVSKPTQHYQSSEKYEVSLESDYEFDKLRPTHPVSTQDFSLYHYDHKRSQGANKYIPPAPSSNNENDKISTTTPYYNAWITRNDNYTKNLPRVIITASASVSDSNGKKLNYSVGNLVDAVKPLVVTNYDDYKESDVLLDPFYLDVPKLKKGRNIRSFRRNRRQTIIKVYKYDVASKLDDTIVATTKSPIKSEKIIPPTILDSKIENDENVSKKNQHTTPWVPPDYVDDNYEPLVYHETSSKSNGAHDELHTKRITTENTLVSIHKNEPHRMNDMKNSQSSIIDYTTENNAAKTTLDFVKIETTTRGFLMNSNTKDKKVNESINYSLSSVFVINLNEKNSNNIKHLCSDKKFYKFYPDKTNCRTFHMCSPGKEFRQVLHHIYECDLGTYFNKNSMNCTHTDPNYCEIH